MEGKTHIETERKFLVKNDGYKSEAVGNRRIRQGYIVRESGRTVRVRIADDKAFLTIKGPSPDGLSRMEWETELSMDDARNLMTLCKDGIIDKNRYLIPAGDGRYFEVDEFHGDNEGLTVAEIELSDADEQIPAPSWLGKEVSGDSRYYNSCLCSFPFRKWKEN